MPDPLFEEFGDGFKVTIFRKVRNISEDNSRFANSAPKNERSLKEVLKEVLKEADYKKILSIAEAIDDHGEITPAEAKKLCGKSEATIWRYLKIMVDTGCVVSEGNTNNAVYKRNTELVKE